MRLEVMFCVGAFAGVVGNVVDLYGRDGGGGGLGGGYGRRRPRRHGREVVARRGQDGRETQLALEGEEFDFCVCSRRMRR